MIRTIFIIMSSLLTIGCTVPYIIGIVGQKTKPRVVSWFTWTILTAIAGSAALSDHQYAAAVLSLSATLETLAITMLGLYYNGDRSIARFDVICQIAAIFGLALWLIFNSPAIAVVAAIVIDFIASLPTLKHAWQQPQEETWITYIGGGLAAAFATAAAAHITITALANPIYIMLINFLIALIVINRRMLRA